MNTPASGAYRTREEPAVPPSVSPDAATRSGNQADSLLGKVMGSKALRGLVAAVGLGASPEMLAQSSAVRPPAVGDVVPMVQQVTGAGGEVTTVTNNFQVVTRPGATSQAVKVGLAPASRSGPQLQSFGAWVNVPPVGSIITNVVDGVTNRFLVKTEPQFNTSHVGMLDPAKRLSPIGNPVSASGTYMSNLPGTYNLVVGFNGVFQLRGDTTAPHVLPDAIDKLYPSLVNSTNAFYANGAQKATDPEKGISVYPVSTFSSGVSTAKRSDGLFDIAIDFTDPDVWATAKGIDPATPQHWIVKGAEQVVTLATSARAGIETTRVAVSEAPATSAAHGIVVSQSDGAGFIETLPRFASASNKPFNVCIGAVTVGLELLPDSPPEPQKITISLTANTDGSLTVGFSEALKYPAYLSSGYWLGQEGTSFYPIVELEAGMSSVTLDPDYVNAANLSLQSGGYNPYTGGSMFFVVQPRDPVAALGGKPTSK